MLDEILDLGGGEQFVKSFNLQLLCSVTVSVQSSS